MQPAGGGKGRIEVYVRSMKMTSATQLPTVKLSKKNNTLHQRCNRLNRVFDGMQCEQRAAMRSQCDTCRPLYLAVRIK